MWRNLRIMLMWLLALAIPCQGFAAASMLNCGPGHHRAPSAHSHDGHAHQHAGGPAASDHQVAKGSTIHKAMKGSCSACSSCCTSVAIPSAAVTFEATPVNDFFDPLTPRSVASFVADGPERPPRYSLA